MEKKLLTSEEMLIGCEHDGSFIPKNEVLRLMQAYASQEVEKHTERIKTELIKARIITLSGAVLPCIDSTKIELT